MDNLPSEELAPIIQKLFYDIPLLPHDLAVAVRKPYSTLMREVNPYDDKAKLGILTYFDIASATGSVNVMHYMADKLGYKLIKK